MPELASTVSPIDPSLTELLLCESPPEVAVSATVSPLSSSAHPGTKPSVHASANTKGRVIAGPLPTTTSPPSRLVGGLDATTKLAFTRTLADPA
jgi:hypothetical protein